MRIKYGTCTVFYIHVNFLIWLVSGEKPRPSVDFEMRPYQVLFLVLYNNRSPQPSPSPNFTNLDIYVCHAIYFINAMLFVPYPRLMDDRDYLPSHYVENFTPKETGEFSMTFELRYEATDLVFHAICNFTERIFSRQKNVIFGYFGSAQRGRQRQKSLIKSIE